MAGAPANRAQAAQLVSQTDRLIVKYRDSVPAGNGAAKATSITAAREAILKRAGQQHGMTLKALHTIATGAHVFKLDRTVSLDEANALASELMARDPSVAYAEPDRILTRAAVPNDPRYTEQWHYYEDTGGLRLPTAWDKSIGAGITVAVIDSGFRPHVDLSGQILQGYDFISIPIRANDGDGRDPDASDPGDWVKAGECGTGSPVRDELSSWHGTHVAGTIAALSNNSTGVAGVASGAKILPVRVLGKCGGFTSDIADGIIWASGGTVKGVPVNANKAQVINMSISGTGACPNTTQEAINIARSRGVVVVAAAGNDATDANNANPANCLGAIAVAATNRTGGRASYSNFGTVVDVAAPGGDSGAGNGVLSTVSTGTTSPGEDSYAFFTGTSMAAPHVAGVAALMLAVNGDLTPNDIEYKLRSSVRPFPASCPGCGAGIVDASAAVDAAATTSPPLAEAEPNDTPASANIVTTSGTLVFGSMASTTDSDVFVVQIPPGTTLATTLRPNLTSDYDLYIYDSTGTPIASSANETALFDSTWAINSGTTTATVYALVVYYSGETGPDSGRYALTFNW